MIDYSLYIIFMIVVIFIQGACKIILGASRAKKEYITKTNYGIEDIVAGFIAVLIAIVFYLI